MTSGRNVRRLCVILAADVAGYSRPTTQLIDATTSTHVWANRYDRDLANIFAVQVEITREIADALRLRPSPGRLRRTPGIVNLEAKDLFRHRELAWLLTREAATQDSGLLRRALERFWTRTQGYLDGATKSCYARSTIICPSGLG